MFFHDKWFKLGWIYFFLQFFFEAFLPQSFGKENGVVENLQMLWLLGGFLFSCWMIGKQGGTMKLGGAALWKAGAIIFFLAFMREISWGRAVLRHADGRSYTYADMGVFGQLVHPLIGVLIIVALYYIYRAQVWRLIPKVKLPLKSSVLFLLFILCSWVAEKQGWFSYKGLLAEELSEFGVYMMGFVVVVDFARRVLNAR